MQSGTTDLVIDLVPLPALSITGSVVDTRGRPVVGAFVTADPPEGSAFESRSAQTDSEGKFEVFGLEDTEYRINALPPPGTRAIIHPDRRPLVLNAGARDVKLTLDLRDRR